MQPSEPSEPSEPSHGRVSHDHSLVPSPSVITDARERAHFVRKYREAWSLPPSVDYFAGPSPVSLERRHLALLAEEECIVSLKTDGVRYMLLLTEAEDGASVALMINRAMVMYEIEVWAHTKYFEGSGSLFDGELVWEYVNYKPQLRFIIYDVMRCAGALQTQQTYANRMQGVFGRILSERPTAISEASLLERDGIMSAQSTHNLTFGIKQLMPMSSLGQLWQERDASYHSNDGLIFVLNSRPIGINTSDSIFKWKHSHTIDVLAYRVGDKGDDKGDKGDKGDDKWMVRALNKSEQVALTEVRVQDKVYTVELVENELVEDGALVECECTLCGPMLRLFPLKQRIDKKAPNNVYTIQRTVLNIVEKIDIEELIALKSR